MMDGHFETGEMRLDAARRLAARLLADHPRAWSLPGEFYNDPGLYSLDMRTIFEREWIFAGLVSEIPKPGDYLTLDIGRTPVIVLRDQRGEVRGFYNTCRHRGSKLLEETCGHTAALVCPYHRWTYKLSGELAQARFMPDDFDRATMSLRPVSVALAGATIFVSLAETPPDFDAFAEALTPLLAPHRLDQSKLAHTSEIVERGNWKLVMENSRECYHCAHGHRELVRTLLDLYDFRDPSTVGPVRDYWAQWEAAGLPWEMRDGPNYRGTRLPFTNGARTISTDGAPVCAVKLGIDPPGQQGSLRWVHYPTLFAHAHPDYAALFRMLPLGPELTLVTTKYYVHRDAQAGRDYRVEDLTRVWDVTNDQDRALVERNQAGVNSVGYRPGPYSPTLEAGVIKFVDWYRARLEVA